MAEKTTTARPYAKAAFEHAQASNALAKWSEMLQVASRVVDDKRVHELLYSPHLSTDELAGLLVEICGDVLSKDGENFLRVLAASERLDVLPQIAEIFEKLKADAENTVEVHVTSAIELSDAERETIKRALHQRLAREIVLQCSVDGELIGGAVVRADDLVIDGSVRGRLERLAGAITH